MKLNALHLFLILLGSLIFCSILGNPTVEGMSGKTGRAHKANKPYKIIINEYSTPPKNEEHNTQTTTQQQQQLIDSSNKNTNYHSTNYYGSDNSNNEADYNNNEYSDDNVYDDYDDETEELEEPEYNTLKGNQIPAGSEDLYVLKSEIVPPVCPACPTNASCPRQEAAPPCPPCARCPEPSFECKKVPNYRVNDDDSLPRPVLADFSQFGM